MNESSFPKSRQFKNALYPLVFPVAVCCLAFFTFNVVNRLSVQIAVEKIGAIVETGGTAYLVWSDRNQKAVDFMAANETLVASLALSDVAATSPLSTGNEAGVGDERNWMGVEVLLQEMADAFDFSGLTVFRPNGVSVLASSIQSRRSLAIQNAMQVWKRDVRPDPLSTAPRLVFEGNYSYFVSEIYDEKGKRLGYLVAELPHSNGLSAILRSSSIGKSGRSLLVDANGVLVAVQSPDKPSGLSLATRAFIRQLFQKHSAATEGSTQVELAGLDNAGIHFHGIEREKAGELVGAARIVQPGNTAILTLVERDEVFAASLALRRILLGILGLSLLASAMNWVYHFRLFALRRRVALDRAKVRQLGQYTLESKVGEGGMGVVYKASHALLQRPTAVKLILPDRASNETIENFEREVMLTSRLTHPNTIAIYDYGRNEDGIFYYAMEYLDGMNLATLVSVEGPQPWARVVHILRQICDSLEEAHTHGLIHRDIKPENVMLCRRGNRHDVVKVLDFGLAGDFSRDETLDSIRVQGTPAYMAPEAILSPNKIDVRVDVYAVAAVGYYLLSGQHVFTGGSINSIIKQQLNSQPIALAEYRSDVPNSLQKLIEECLHKNPANRPGTIEDVCSRLLSLSSDVWTEDDARKGWSRMEDTTSQAVKVNSLVATSSENHSMTKTIDF